MTYNVFGGTLNPAELNTWCCVSVERDMKDRGRQLEQILHQYMTYVKPAFEEFCLPVSQLLSPFVHCV